MFATSQLSASETSPIWYSPEDSALHCSSLVTSHIIAQRQSGHRSPLPLILPHVCTAFHNRVRIKERMGECLLCACLANYFWENVLDFSFEVHSPWRSPKADYKLPPYQPNKPQTIPAITQHKICKLRGKCEFYCASYTVISPRECGPIQHNSLPNRHHKAWWCGALHCQNHI